MLTQAREKEGYGSHNWNAGMPVVAEASMTLQCSTPREVDPGRQDPGSGVLHRLTQGVGSDLRLHTVHLGAALAAVAVCACLWGPR